LGEYNLYDIMPNWVQPLIGSREERIVKLKDSVNRAAMKQDVDDIWGRRRLSSVTPELYRTDWSRVRVFSVAYDRNQKYDGVTIKELAEATGKHPVDAFIELALDEELKTEFTVPQNPVDTETADLIKRMTSPYSHISLSDGGAHVKYETNANWPIYFLANWVRDREIMSLEEAHYKISSLPAWIASFKDRGTLQVGAWADLIVYDLEKLGMLHDRPVFANDFPGNERRFIQKPTGLRYTLVNGAMTFEDNVCTNALPGRLLRSYDMVG
jgi:N-acyl-D-aspartate/D-glutamate deacylase